MRKIYMEEITRKDVYFGYDDLETSEDSITIEFPNVTYGSTCWTDYFENPHSNEYDVHLETKDEHFYDVPEWMEIVDYSNLEPYIDEPDCLPNFTFSYEGDVVTLREFMKKYVFGGLISEADQEDLSYWED